MARQSLLLVLLITSFTAPAAARVYEYQLNCDLGKGAAHSSHVGHFEIHLRPENSLCRVEIQDSAGRRIFERTSSGMQVFAGRGFAGNDEPEAIVQTDDIPYRLFIISLDFG